MKRILCVLSSTALMFVTLGGCQSQEDTIQDLSDGLSAVDAVSSISSETELFSERDLDPSYEEASAVQIELNGTEAAATGDGVTDQRDHCNHHRGRNLFAQRVSQRRYGHSAIIFSSPDLTSGSAYTVTASTVTGKTTAQ